MWDNIAAAAAYGAIGGGVGALVGMLLAAPFRNTRFAQTASTILTVAFVIIGYNVAEPLLKPYIGEYLPKSEAQTDFDRQFDELMAEFEKFPTMVAMFEREPGLRDQLKSDLQAATSNAVTATASNTAAFATAYTLVQARFLHYVARATDEHMARFLSTNVEVTEDLLVRNPQFCYDMNYNPGALASLNDVEALRAKFGPGLFDRQQEEGAELIRSAYDDVPVYDVSVATAGLQAAGQEMVQVLGEENTGLITGERFAENEDEATLACAATLAMLKAILAFEEPVVVGRHIFANL